MYKIRIIFVKKGLLKVHFNIKKDLNTPTVKENRSVNFLAYLINVLQESTLNQLQCVSEFIKPPIQKTVEKCYNVLKASNEKGIFSAPDCHTTVTKVKEKIENHYSVDLSSYPIHTIASICKSIFRVGSTDLNNIITDIIYPSLYLEYSKKIKQNGNTIGSESENEATNIKLAREVIYQLTPKCFHYYKMLFEILHLITTKPEINMTIENLCMVFQPILQLPAAFLTLLINKYDKIFKK